MPYIHTNQLQVYMRPPSWTPLPPPSPSHLWGSSQCTSPEHPISCIKPGLEIYFTYGNIHVSMLVSQIIPPLPSPTEPKSLLFTSASLLLSRIEGCRYHLSKFLIYVLVYCKGLSSQGYGFSNGHVWMQELDSEESWVPKNWCFWTVVLEKTLESPLGCKEIQSVHSKGY